MSTIATATRIVPSPGYADENADGLRRPRHRPPRSPALALLYTTIAGTAGCYIAVDSSNGKGGCVPGDSSCNDSPVGPKPAPGGPGTGGASPTSSGGTYAPGNDGPGAGAGGVQVPGGSRGTGGAGVGGTGAGGTAGQAAGPNAPLPRAPAPPSTCPGVTVSRFNELLIVDPGVTGDARASNAATSRPWSFRQRLESLVGGSADAAGSLADAWLASWSTLTDVPVSTAPDAPRVPIDARPAAQTVLRCPWLRESRENACDAACASCRSRHLDLPSAPFRLLAIANRVDLAGSQPTTTGMTMAMTGAGGATGGAAACGTDGGEIRFAYTAVDPATLRALPFTVIFEYGITLWPGETLRDWAAVWHELGTLSLGSAAYNARLESVAARALARATLKRVLTNESAFGAPDGLPWEMRQFVPALTDGGTVRLVEIAMPGTPRLTLGPSAELGQWIDDNAGAVLAGSNPLPASMVAASAPIPTAAFAWATTARNTEAGAAFNRNTCNGCHGGRIDPMDVPFQHVAPAADAYYGGGAGSSTTVRVSRYLHNPGYDDELGRRERKMAELLCTACGATTY